MLHLEDVKNNRLGQVHVRRAIFLIIVGSISKEKETTIEIEQGNY